MTKVENYRCQRCGVIFQKDVDEKPSVLRLEDHDIAWDLKEPLQYYLCEDCVAYFYSWMEHEHKYDNFADSMQKKWEEKKE